MNSNKYELTAEQQSVINSKSKFLVIVAGPGTGKTETLIHFLENKVKDEDVMKSAVCSFTKNSSNEIEKRAKAKMTDKKIIKCHFSTFDSFLHNHMWKFFINRILEFISKEYELPLYKTMEIKDIQFPPFKFVDIKDNLTNKDWMKPKLLSFAESASKGILINSPMSEYILLKFIDRNKDIQKYISKSWKRIIIDEAQDLNIIRHWILQSMHKNCGVEVVLMGDPKQTIYGFTGADKGIFEKIKNNTSIDSSEINLSKNFRYKGRSIEISNILSSGDKVSLKKNIETAIKQKSILVVDDLNKSLLSIINQDETALILFKKNEDLEKTVSKLKINKNDLGMYLRLENNKINNLTIREISFIENLYLYKLLLEGDITSSQLGFSPIDEITTFLWPYDDNSNIKFLKLFWSKKINFEDVIKQIEKKVDFNVINLWKIYDENQNYLSKIPQKKVHAMTIHGSKGLEADYIFIEKRTIIDFFKDAWNSDFENMYVALSRLKKKIYLFD